MSILEEEDIKYVAEQPYEWNKLSNKTILISGGTGFIGTFFCNVIRYRNKYYNQNIKIVCISLNKYNDDSTVSYITQNICQPLNVSFDIDYIIHLASNTHPEQYKKDPVGTITTNIFGCYNLLELAKEKKSKRFLMASSCEIYGNCKEELVDELYCGYINSNTARAGYNESKRVCESLCQSYAQQYNIESCVFRLARVFGPDRTKNDSKVMSQFINNALNDHEIIMKSNGKQKYSYIYIADAVSGIICVLLHGISGEAYNVSSNYDGLSLRDYAEYISCITNSKLTIQIEENASASQAVYALLDVSKIKKIGFSPRYTVKEGINRTINIMRTK